MFSTGSVRSIGCPALLLVAILFALTGCGAIPRTTVTELPEQTIAQAPDNQLLAHVLIAGIRPNGSFNPTSIRTDTELTTYLQQVAETQVTRFASRTELLAFWINAHNAWVLDILRSNRFSKNVDDISGFRSSNVAIVGGKRYTLSEIEENVIGKDFREPRAFFGLYIGARSGPKLAAVPFEPEKLSEQLDKATFGFFRDSLRVTLDRKQNTLWLSPFVNEHVEALERASGNLYTFVRAFASSGLGEYMDQHHLMKISYRAYDWSLF